MSGAERKQKTRTTVKVVLIFVCGLYWTRTSDPIDVNDVLYQPSQQTANFEKSLFSFKKRLIESGDDLPYRAVSSQVLSAC